MIDLQVPLLAAKALLLLLLFAFVYVVVRRAVSDLRNLSKNTGTFVASEAEDAGASKAGVVREAVAANGGERGRGGVAAVDQNSRPSNRSELVVEESEDLSPGTHYSIGREITVIGRSSANDISLRNDDYASGEHARLMRQQGVLYIEDMSSTNGTFVNGKKCSGTMALKPGDALRIGSTTFRYRE